MDRLKEISRQGGYPWVAEEIEIIEKHADYINALLDGLRMPAKSCVFVQKNTNQSGTLQKSVVYVVASDNGKGELFVLEADDDIMVADLLSGTAAKLHVDIVPTDVGVTGAQDVTWLACYTTNRVTLTDDAEDYTFYDLNDLLRPARWTDLVGHLRQQAEISPAGTACMEFYDGYEQRIRKTMQELDVDLKYVVKGDIDSIQTVLHDLDGVNLGLGDNESRQLNCMVKHYTTILDYTCTPALCYITNGGIYMTGITAKDHTGHVNTSMDEVYVWGRVSLK